MGIGVAWSWRIRYASRALGVVPNFRICIMIITLMMKGIIELLIPYLIIDLIQVLILIKEVLMSPALQYIQVPRLCSIDILCFKPQIC